MSDFFRKSKNKQFVKTIVSLPVKQLYTRLELITTCKIIINIIIYLVIKSIHNYNSIWMKIYSISFNCIML